MEKISATELLQAYQNQIQSLGVANTVSYANYSDQYTNNSGGSYTNGK